MTGAKPRVAIVGLGNMGLAVADRVRDGDYPLLVFNRTPGRDAELVESGATRLDSVASALSHADVCLTTLSDDGAVEAVVCGGEGVLGRARPGTVLVEMSTISVAASARIAQAAAESGVHYLRAPFSGNPDAIRSGRASLFVSGPAATASRCEPLLRAVAPTVRYLGDGERARVAKLVLQVLVGGTAELLAEALVLGESAGVDRETLLDVIRASVIGSAFVEYKAEPLLRDDYSATFTTAMMAKDVGLVLDLADQIGAHLPFTAEFRSLLETACESGYADKDFMSLVLQLRERAPGARPSTRNR